MMDPMVPGEGDKLSPSNSAKKLKQSRLPFQVLTAAPPKLPPRDLSESRKRKPSNDAAELAGRVAKIGRIADVKENMTQSVVIYDDDVLVSVASTVSGSSEDLSAEDDAEVAEVAEVAVVAEVALVADVAEVAEVTAPKEATAQKSDGKPGKRKSKVESKILIKLPVVSKRQRDDAKNAPDKVKTKRKSKASTATTAEKDDELGDKKDTSTSKDADDVHEHESLVASEKQAIEKDAVTEENGSTAPEESTKETTETPSPQSRKSRSSARGTEKRIKTTKASNGVSLEDPSVTPTSRKRSRNSGKLLSKESEETSKADEASTEDDSIREASADVSPTTPMSKKRVRKSDTKSSPGAGATAAASKEVPKGAKVTIPAQKKHIGKADKNGSPTPSSAKKKGDQKPSPESSDVVPDSAIGTPKTEKSPNAVAGGSTVKKDTMGPLSRFFAKATADKQDVEKKISTAAGSKGTTLSTISLDDSADENEEDVYMLCTPNSKSALTADELAKKLTPKQLARRQEAERKQAQKVQEREEKRRKLLDEKEAKVREKEEQEKQRKREREEKEEQKRKEREEKEEQKRKEREEKDEQRKREREEKDKKRLAELEAKNEEKRQKEEERKKKDEQKEEERKKKEEEKEAIEKKKQKESHAFTSFFVKKPVGKEPKISDDENSIELQTGAEVGQLRFMPFCVKGDMRLAPLVRSTLDKKRRARLEEVLKEGTLPNGRKHLYLAQLKSGPYQAGRAERTWIPEEEEVDDDIYIVDENLCHQIEEDPAMKKEKHRAKFFLFEENRRPPYRGTWRKRSTCIKPRRPLELDTKFFDYEVDSDDEWEEEEPGESLHGSDDEKEVDPEDDYDVDNEFLVPHGHLSDEEMQAEDEQLEDNSPEAQKAKLKILQQEFDAQMKKKTEKIKPRLIGCIWEQDDNGENGSMECSAIIRKILNDRAMLFDPDEPISFTAPRADSDSLQSTPAKEGERVVKRTNLTDEAERELVQLMHGNVNNRKFLVREFHAFWTKRNEERDSSVERPPVLLEFSLESIRRRIREIAVWRPYPQEGSMQGKLCWTVHDSVLAKHELQELPMPNEWQYQLQIFAKRLKKTPETSEESDKSSPPKNGKRPPEKVEELPAGKGRSGVPPAPVPAPAASATITKFTKVLSEEEKKKFFSAIEVNDKRKGKASTSATAAVANGIPPSKTKTAQPAGQPQKKRVQLLMSVPRGQNINQTAKNTLISQFLAKSSNQSSDKRTGNEAAKQPDPMEVDDVIEID